MKKSILAVAGVAAFAGVAMPVAGAFAADTDFTDTITVTVDSACAIARGASEAGSYDFGSVANGVTKTVNGSTFKVTCNDKGGYYVYLEGDGTGTTKTDMIGKNTSTTIATGTATSDDKSNWAIKGAAVEGTYEPTIASGYTSYAAIPAAPTSGSEKSNKFASYANNTDTSDGSSFTTSYWVYISAIQAADTYTGKVKFTLMHPDANAS